MRLWAILIVGVFPMQVLAQQESNDEHAAMIDDLIEAVNRNSDCELAVLWQHADEAAGHLTVRVFGRGDGCDEAILEANDLGSPWGITFARIPKPGETIQLNLKIPSRPKVRRPPEDFSLIHEVVETP